MQYWDANYRVTEWLKSKGHLKVIWSNLLAQAGPPTVGCPRP